MKVFLSPHSDDAVLFGAFLILRYEPIVVTALRSKKQEMFGIKHAQREKEDVAAMCELGVSVFQQWAEPDVDPDWEAVRSMVAELDYSSSEYVDQVFAPAIEEGGHDQHNMIGQLAQDIFGNRVTSYLTYTRHRGRSTDGNEVTPEPWMIACKLRALSCYGTQMHPETGCQTWFLDGIREYVA